MMTKPSELAGTPTADTEQPETLEVPHPMSCTIAELREVHDVFHVDLLRVFTEAGIFSINVIEPLAYLGFRRQGLARQAARRAAGGVTATQMVPDDLPGMSEDEAPNATSSAG